MKMGLATSQPYGLLRLTPFPSARRGGTPELHALRKELLCNLFCFHTSCLQTSLLQGYKNKKMPLCDISLLRLFCSGGRWGCCSLLKILTTSIYRPFQPLFFTIWSHIGLRKIVPCICKYNDSS